MSEIQDSEALAEALMRRAQQLADEEKQLGEHERNRLLSQARERIERRRQRTEKLAAQQSEQHYRQLVQRAQLDNRARLEQLRWVLTESVLSDIREALNGVQKDFDCYHKLLLDMIQQGCGLMPDTKIIAHLNNRDYSQFHGEWKKLLAESRCNADIELSEERCDCIGGILLTTADGNTRLDNRFEARLERLTPVLARLIDDILFSAVDNGEVSSHAG